MTKQEFIQMILANGENWLSGYFEVEGKQIGIKSYGLWTQRLEFDGFRHTIPEQKTKRGLNAELEKLL